MFRLSVILVICLAVEWLGTPAAARAQGTLTGCHASQTQNMTFTKLADDHYVLDGTADAPVQIECDDLQLFADHAEIFQVEGRIVARGNVVYVSGGNRISAERMDFNTKTRTGTFYVAFGTATLRNTPETSLFGSPEPDLIFRGDEVRKIGPKKYQIIRGNFTTCVQPTPRWEMQSRSITLNLDHYAFLKSTLFRVKHVPLMYLPYFYYPIQEDGRATGFIMPVYGNTTARGHSISNAFFWAISRSQDATIMHDWFAKTGQGIGGEYRYVLSPGSQGNSQVSFLNEHAATFTLADGTSGVTDARKSYTVVGSLTQRLPFSLSARAHADYYSSVVTQQRYQQDIYRATQNRGFGGNVSGSWNEYSLSATADRTDYFSSATSFQTVGSLPRVAFSRAERPIGGAPVYFGVNSDFAALVRSTTTGSVKTTDQGLTRVDVNPTLRLPFTRWPFLTANSFVSWRGTYWTESLDGSRIQVPTPIHRQFFDFQTRITGPVFNRIWNKPGNGYAEKFKHVIEPTLTIQRVTAVDNFDRIVALDGSDYIVGSLTRFNYGVANRLYAKKESSREILSATVSQNYYSQVTAARYDTQNQSGYGVTAPTHFGPVALQVRSAPTDLLQVDFRTEWDSTAHTLRTLGTNGSVSAGNWLQATAGWSQRRYIPTLRGFDDPYYATNYLNANANVRSDRSHVAASYSFNYDLRRSIFAQQRYTASYTAQCCGVGVEYQTFNLLGSFGNFGGLDGLGLMQDHRFNLSFTLVGVGTFSNLFGAFGGQTR